MNAGHGAQDRLDLSARVLGFDMTALLETPRLRTPVMMYLFHRIEELLDGSPTMILIDEGWKALDDPVFAARIRDWPNTLRKRNALPGFAPQSARDRAHRRGERRTVTIYRILARDTVEEKVMQRPGRKRELAQGILEGRASEAPLNVSELRELLQPSGEGLMNIVRSWR